MLLTTLADGLWTVDDPMVRLGIDLRHRMAVVRGARGLVVHSPVACREELARELESLGGVRAVLAPNLFHDLYFPGWFERFPDARFLCAPGFRAGHPRLPFHGDLSAASVAELGAELELELIGGMPKVNECVLIHRPSRTAIVADLVFNLGDGFGWWGRTFLRFNGIYDRPGPSRLFRHFIRDRRRFAASLERVLAHDFDRLIVGHGDVVDGDAKRILREAFERVDLLER